MFMVLHSACLILFFLQETPQTRDGDRTGILISLEVGCIHTNAHKLVGVILHSFIKDGVFHPREDTGETFHNFFGPVAGIAGEDQGPVQFSWCLILDILLVNIHHPVCPSEYRFYGLIFIFGIICHARCSRISFPGF